MSYIDALRIDGTDYEIKDSKAIHRDEWLDIIYPIGSIYWNKTNSNNPSEYLGGEWRAITNQVLVAAGTTFPINTSGGSKDAVVVSHNHTQNAHTHTQNAHTHSQNSHTHAQYGHSHKYYHYHDIAHGKFLVSYANIQVNYTTRALPKSDAGGVRFVYADSDNGISEEVYTNQATNTEVNSATASNQYTTATNNNATATNNNTTATNNAAGVSGTNKNMPPYVTAYCWERVG